MHVALKRSSIRALPWPLACLAVALLAIAGCTGHLAPAGGLLDDGSPERQSAADDPFPSAKEAGLAEAE